MMPWYGIRLHGLLSYIYHPRHSFPTKQFQSVWKGCHSNFYKSWTHWYSLLYSSRTAIYSFCYCQHHNSLTPVIDSRLPVLCTSQAMTETNVPIEPHKALTQDTESNQPGYRAVRLFWVNKWHINFCSHHVTHRPCRRQHRPATCSCPVCSCWAARNATPVTGSRTPYRRLLLVQLALRTSCHIQ